MQTEQNLPSLSGAVIWLIPSDADAARFHKEIDRLSDRFKTPPFLPHLTLGRLTNKYSNTDFITPLKSITSVSGDNYYAFFDSVTCTESPYQNLIVSLKTSEKLEHLQSRIESAVPGYAPKDEYHISLMYGDISCGDLQDEIKSLPEIFPEKICFSKMSAVQLNGKPGTWRRVWEQYI